MKFLYIGDRHNRETAPFSRLDNFKETALKKDLEIQKIARENDVSAILHPGDWWEELSKRSSNEFVKEVLTRWLEIDSNLMNLLLSSKSNEEVLKVLNKRSTSIPIIGVAGNHDMIGGDPSTINQRTAGLLDFIGLMPLVTKEHPMFFTDPVTNKKIVITGTGYHSLIDTPECLDDYIVTEKLGDFHIHIVHGMLVDKKGGPWGKYTTIDDIKHTKADVTLAGHLHTGFKTVEYDGKYFINPGSVLRTSCSKVEMARKPHVVLLDFSDKVKVIEVPLSCAEAGEKVLSRDAILIKNQKDSVSEIYNSEINSYKLKKSDNILDVLDDVLNSEKISETVKKGFKEKLQAKMGTERHSIPTIENTWIQSIHIENFQSHEDTVLNFSPGMNVLVGESRQGKSATIRAIRWVYENKPSGTRFIRKGYNWARVTIVLGNGTIVSRKVEAAEKGPAKNEYKIIYSNGELVSGNTKLLEEAQKVLGLCSLYVDEKTAIDINFLLQGKGWFLVGEDYSPGDRAKIVGSLMDTNSVDSCIKDVELELKHSNQKVTAIQKEVVSLEENILSYNDLPDDKIRLDKIEALFVTIDNLEQKKKKIEAIQKDIDFNKIELEKCNEIITQILPDKIQDVIKLAEGCVKQYISLSNILQAIKDYSVKIEENKELILKFSKMKDVNLRIASLRVKIDLKQTLERCLKEIEIAQKNIDYFKDIEASADNIGIALKQLPVIEKNISIYSALCLTHSEITYDLKRLRTVSLIFTNYGDVEKHLKSIKDIETTISKLSAVNALSLSIKKCEDELSKTQSTAKQMESQIKEVEEKRLEILANLKICPTCGHEIVLE